MGKIKLSVVIPAYNEVVNLKKGVLDEVENYLKSQSNAYEVIIVDDGSKDKTVDLIEELIEDKPRFRLIKNQHSGKAVTVMTGMTNAEGEIIVFTDMDQATPIDQVEKFFPKFDEGFDIVIGSRSGRKGAPLIRKLSAWGFAFLRNIILGLPYNDTQCGFKAFTLKAAHGIFPKLLEYWQHSKAKGGAVNAGFDVETLFLAKQKNLKIVEVGVEWRYVDTERVQVIGDAFQAIKDMLRIRLNSWSGKYN